MIPLWQLLADEGNEIQQIFKKKTSFRGSLKCLFLRMSYNYVTFLSWTFPFHKYYELELNTYVHLNCMHHAAISLWKLSQNYGFLKIYLQLHKSFGNIVQYARAVLINISSLKHSSWTFWRLHAIWNYAMVSFILKFSVNWV